MNKHKLLNKNNLLIVPYTIWMTGFIIIPLIFILFYAFTTRDGHFTLNNILSFFDFKEQVHIKSFMLTITFNIIFLIINY